jgi:hypothetical protein
VKPLTKQWTRSVFLERASTSERAVYLADEADAVIRELEAERDDARAECEKLQADAYAALADSRRTPPCKRGSTAGASEVGRTRMVGGGA